VAVISGEYLILACVAISLKCSLTGPTPVTRSGNNGAVISPVYDPQVTFELGKSYELMEVKYYARMVYQIPSVEDKFDKYFGNFYPRSGGQFLLVILEVYAFLNADNAANAKNSKGTKATRFTIRMPETSLSTACALEIMITGHRTTTASSRLAMAFGSYESSIPGLVRSCPSFFECSFENHH